jgi:SAM-dependent methyltransferase
MNTKIFNLVLENLESIFKFSVDADTPISQLDWNESRLEQFKLAISTKLDLEVEPQGTVGSLVQDLGYRYIKRFFGETWSHTTKHYQQTGWALVDVVNALNPQKVLDVGCGFNVFKGKINNLIGIDPYNSAADVQVDIRDYKDAPESYDVILALGSICYHSQDEIEHEFSHCVNLLKSQGKFFMRLNPDAYFQSYPYMDFFPWSIDLAKDFAKKYSLVLDTWEPDTYGRFYCVFTKL